MQNKIQQLSSFQDFNEKVLKSDLKSIILVFGAEWCQPYKNLVDNLLLEVEIQRKKLQGNFQAEISIPIYKVDIENDNLKDVVKLFAPTILPSCYLFEEGKFVASFGGMDIFAVQKMAVKAFEQVAK